MGPGALLAALGGDAAAAAPLPRTLVVTAHPDDETVGAGSRLPRLAAARFACITDGAPRDGADAARHGFTPAQYAQARRRELHAVLAACGIAPERLLSLACPDQQAALRLAPLARQVAALCADEAIEAVLTHACEGGHPDHDAAAFAVHAACALLRRHGGIAPAVVEMAGYHRGPQGLATCEFLPQAQADASLITVRLTREEQDFKRALVARYATQQEVLAQFPLDVERFRPAPAYDFTAPPHPGPLHYEAFPWGWTGARFRALAAAALDQLGLEGPL